jgi:sensor histidine kinase YesM
MLLQTLVENAIKHGIAELQGGGVLQIQSGLNAGVLTITVQNPRPETVANSGEGIGLRNAHERLRLLYGTGASLHLDMSHARMALVRLTLPASA